MTAPRDPDSTPRAPRLGDSTRAIRAASRTPEVLQRPTSIPIFQTATFTSADAESLAAVVGDARAGYSYSRLSNPTTTALGDAYAELAGGEAGIALASGMAAIHAACAAVLRAGDRVVAPLAGYGSTRVQLVEYFGRFGVAVELVDITDLDAVAAALAASPTRLLFAESSANPTTFVADHAALAELAHRHEALYVVDNTFASSHVCRPLELGADLVVESATKYLGGHSDVIGGVVAGSRALVDAVAKVQVDTGAILAPFEAFLSLRGILTFADPDGPPRPERPGTGRLARASGGRGTRPLPGPALPPPARGRRAPVAPRQRRRDARLRGRRRARRRPGASSTPWASRSGRRRSGASTRWSSTRPRRLSGS